MDRRLMKVKVTKFVPAGILTTALAVLCMCVITMPRTAFSQVAPAQTESAVGTAAPTSAPSQVLHITGPETSKALLSALVAEFANPTRSNSASQPSAGGSVGLEFLRLDAPAGSAMAFIRNQDMMVVFGRMTDKMLGSNAAAWKALKPSEQILGARSVAIVVHPRNTLESLTIEQLQAIFSGKMKDWKALGGMDKPIRCFGTLQPDPFARIFNEKVLIATRFNGFYRKKDSAEVISTVIDDIQGIGFVDASEAIAAGGNIKILAVGADKDAVSPNAQTIKDGSYPLAELLMLYVSPKASNVAGDFLQFLAAGGGDAVCRKFTFLPGLHSVIADMTVAFEKLYGQDIKRVQTTPDVADDIALAAQILNTAKTTKLDPDMLEVMCVATFDLTCKIAGGEGVALESMRFLTERRPQKEFDCARRRAVVYEQAYARSKSAADATVLIDILKATADLGMADHRYVESAEAWRRALVVATESNSPKLKEIQDRLAAFEARSQLPKEVDALAAALKDNPNDLANRTKMLWLQLTEMDDPAKALTFMNSSVEDTVKTNLPLAAGDISKLNADSALKLAEWYVSLVDVAQTGGKELMARRAIKYYQQFFLLHKDRTDPLATRAEVGIKKVGGTVPPPVDPKVKTPVGPGDPPADMTDLQLAEFLAKNPNVVFLARRDYGTAKNLTTLMPFANMQKLTSLELIDAEKIKDLSPLAKLTSLGGLTITNCPADNFTPVAGLTNLTSLTLDGCKNLTDLTILAKLKGLKTLTISKAPELVDISAIEKLDLTSLTISNCDKLQDFSAIAKLKNLTRLVLRGNHQIENLSAIEGMKKLQSLDMSVSERLHDISAIKSLTGLTELRLSNCGNIEDLTPLENLDSLKSLNLSWCSKLTLVQVEALQAKLSKCKIESNAK